MMALLRAELPGTAVVSIGHRPGLERHHDRVLVLEASPQGAVLAAPDLPEDEGVPRDKRTTGTHRHGAAHGGSAKAGFFAGALRALSRRFRWGAAYPAQIEALRG
jgi:hypothetical protein